MSVHGRWWWQWRKEGVLTRACCRLGPRRQARSACARAPRREARARARGACAARRRSPASPASQRCRKPASCSHNCSRRNTVSTYFLDNTEDSVQSQSLLLWSLYIPGPSIIQYMLIRTGGVLLFGLIILLCLHFISMKETSPIYEPFHSRCYKVVIKP